MRSSNRPAGHRRLSIVFALGSPLCFAAPLVPLAVPSDDFESYSIGPLAGQGDWYSPNNTGQGSPTASSSGATKRAVRGIHRMLTNSRVLAGFTRTRSRQQSLPLR